LSLENAHFTILWMSRNIVRLELVGTQVVASMTPKSSQQKDDSCLGGTQSPTFGVPYDFVKIAAQEPEGVSKAGN
jgi:hypothetical protein